MENKKLLSNGLIYLCSSVLTQGINLVLIPLYTRNLTQEQFGQYDLILSVQQLLALVISLGVHSGMVRFFNEVKDSTMLKNTAITFSLLWGAVCIGLAYIVNPWLHPVLFNEAQGAELFIPFVVMNAILVGLNAIYSSDYAMRFKALKSSLIHFSTILLTLIFASVFIIGWKMGITGIFLAQLLAGFAVFSFLFMIDIRNFKPRLYSRDLMTMLRYGTGLLLGDISSWVLMLSDRFLIKGYLNLSSVAVYSIGYKVGMLINPVFINPFTSIFTPFKYKVYNEADGGKRIGTMFRIYNFIGWFCVLGLSIFAHFAVSLIATEEYAAAGYLVPIIAFSYFLAGAIDFYSLGLHIARKMRLASMITILAAVVNVGGNMMLIPYIGIYGSAISTVMAYVVSNAVFYYFGSKYYSLGFGWWFPYKYLVIFIPLYGVYWIGNLIINSIVIEILLNIVLCIAYIGLSFGLKFVSKEELDAVWVRSRFGRTTKIAVKGENEKV
ncbi:lipopolysaccharide biosynthesis protein [Paenibacillus faecalis]|uniref:lipopolysaccharide biosynthesis protein n=1 Tax=Paenibacillus faecalis TaxID=2079532 RepID=UPI000D0F2947|nr:oligosaccharide flippase family protein [Paenibacillus faecalis]